MLLRNLIVLVLYVPMSASAYINSEGNEVINYFDNRSPVIFVKYREPELKIGGLPDQVDFQSQSLGTIKSGWSSLPTDELAELIYQTCEGNKIENLDNFEPLKPLEEPISLYSKYEGPHSNYINSLLKSAIQHADRESIEQSPYMTEGNPTVNSLCLLIDHDIHLVVGSSIVVVQSGLDEDGNEADVSWTFRMRADNEAKLLLDDYGEPYDELYYEWSGH